MPASIKPVHKWLYDVLYHLRDAFGWTASGCVVSCQVSFVVQLACLLPCQAPYEQQAYGVVVCT